MVLHLRLWGGTGWVLASFLLVALSATGPLGVCVSIVHHLQAGREWVGCGRRSAEVHPKSPQLGEDSVLATASGC